MGANGAAGLVDAAFRSLLDTLPHPAFVLSADGQAVFYNRAFVDYTGGPLGPSQTDRTLLHHQDDLPALEAARLSARQGSGEFVAEARIRRVDGEYRWHRLHNRPLMQDGERIGYLGTAVDIDDIRRVNATLERRVQERTLDLREIGARYRMFYDRTPVALHSTDADALLIDVNETWTTLFGWAREDAQGRSLADFMTEDSAFRYRQQAWPTIVRSVGGVLVTDYEFVTHDGARFDGRLFARADVGTEGKFVRGWGAVADITAETRAQRELMQAQRMEAVGQLTAGIAHDFNNLLTVVLGSVELLERRLAADSRALHLLGSASRAAERGARLTSQLLAFSRQQSVDPVPVDLVGLIETMLPLLRSTFGDAVGIELRLQPDLALAHADPAKLELAVMNLILNARDAMAEGGACTITAAPARRAPPMTPQEPGEGNYVRLSIADTGPGIPSTLHQRIFEPFFTTKEIGKGSGLGLSQVLGLLKQLGGGVAVSSSPGAGTCFDLFLPEAVTLEPREAVKPGPKPMRALALMVVDDDADVRGVTADMLRSAGHKVNEFASGTEALARLQEAKPDLLLADVVMPGMSGLELATAARRQWPGIPVLFMTGYAEETLLPEVSEMEVIRKPFASADLTARILAVVADTTAR